MWWIWPRPVKALQYLGKQRAESFYEVFNLGTGVGESVLQLIAKFEKVTGLKLNYEIGPRRPGDVEKTYADPIKANTVLGWKTELSLDDALRDAWRWEIKLAGKEWKA
jgi:UDP-glucose 4-epimerase